MSIKKMISESEKIYRAYLVMISEYKQAKWRKQKRGVLLCLTE